MAKFMFATIIGYASTAEEAQAIATKYRGNHRNEHLKYLIDGYIQCDQRTGAPLNEKWCVQVWRHHNAKGVSKFIPLWC